MCLRSTGRGRQSGLCRDDNRRQRGELRYKPRHPGIGRRDLLETDDKDGGADAQRVKYRGPGAPSSGTYYARVRQVSSFVSPAPSVRTASTSASTPVRLCRGRAQRPGPGQPLPAGGWMSGAIGRRRAIPTSYGQRERRGHHRRHPGRGPGTRCPGMESPPGCGHVQQRLHPIGGTAPRRRESVGGDLLDGEDRRDVYGVHQMKPR